MFYRGVAFDMIPEISKAIVNDDIKKVKIIVESGRAFKEFDRFGNGPIHIAVEENNVPILEYLLEKCRNHINNKNLLGETPLYKAVTWRRLDLAEMLILAGAGVNISENNYSATPLHVAVDYPEMAQLLIKYGADLDVTDRYEHTPLHHAVDLNCLETVCMLLYYNADPSITDDRNYTPFMTAVEKQHIGMQEALFEYVYDYDVTKSTDMSILGLAIMHESPFTEEMILRGADVDNVASVTNAAIYLTLNKIKTKGNITLSTLKLIWERINYEPLTCDSILGSLFLIESGVFCQIVEMFMNSDKMSIVAESVVIADDLYAFMAKGMHYELTYDKLEAMVCCLLTHGYTPNEMDMSIIYNNWGYCNLFKILLHFEIRKRPWLESLYKIPARLIYDIHMSTDEILDSMVPIKNYENSFLQNITSTTFIRLLDYYIFPPLINAYLKLNRTDCATVKIKGLPKLPSLLELARNKTREHIKGYYNVKTCGALFTLINNLDIASHYKKILTLESTIYRPIFDENEFQEYLKELRLHQVINDETELLVESSIKNCIVKRNGIILHFEYKD